MGHQYPTMRFPRLVLAADPVDPIAAERENTVVLAEIEEDVTSPSRTRFPPYMVTIAPSAGPGSRTKAIATLSYDPAKELTPITAVAENHFALVVNRKALPVGNLAEFVGYAQKSPGKLSYAHAGRGSISHLAMELLLHRANLQIAGVPYKGIGPAFTDIIAGHVPTMFASPGRCRRAGAAGWYGQGAGGVHPAS